MERKGFFQSEIILNVLVSSSRFIWSPMLWVYCYYKCLILSTAGSTLDVTIWCLKLVPGLKRLKLFFKSYTSSRIFPDLRSVSDRKDPALPWRTGSLVWPGHNALVTLGSRFFAIMDGGFSYATNNLYCLFKWAFSIYYMSDMLPVSESVII